MANSDVSICSDALVLLGDSEFASFDENRDSVRACALVYPRLKKAIIAAHTWRFAMEKAKLTQDAVSPVNEWSYSHVIPGIAVSGKVHALFDTVNSKVAISQYETFKLRVFSEYSELWADYKILPDEAVWPETFVQLMIWALASEIAYAVTDQANAADEWRTRAYGIPSDGGLGGQMAIALSLEAQTQGNIGIYADDFIDARMGY